METYEFTREKMRRERRSRARRVGLVVIAAAATAAIGLVWRDSLSAWDVLRISLLGSAGAFAALVLPK